jgi:hypothetical protein
MEAVRISETSINFNVTTPQKTLNFEHFKVAESIVHFS